MAKPETSGLRVPFAPWVQRAQREFLEAGPAGPATAEARLEAYKDLTEACLRAAMHGPAEEAWNADAQDMVVFGVLESLVGRKEDYRYEIKRPSGETRTIISGGEPAAIVFNFTAVAETFNAPAAFPWKLQLVTLVLKFFKTLVSDGRWWFGDSIVPLWGRIVRSLIDITLDAAQTRPIPNHPGRMLKTFLQTLREWTSIAQEFYPFNVNAEGRRGRRGRAHVERAPLYFLVQRLQRWDRVEHARILESGHHSAFPFDLTPVALLVKGLLPKLFARSQEASEDSQEASEEQVQVLLLEVLRAGTSEGRALAERRILLRAAKPGSEQMEMLRFVAPLFVSAARTKAIFQLGLTLLGQGGAHDRYRAEMREKLEEVVANPPALDGLNGLERFDLVFSRDQGRARTTRSRQGKLLADLFVKTYAKVANFETAKDLLETAILKDYYPEDLLETADDNNSPRNYASSRTTILSRANLSSRATITFPPYLILIKGCSYLFSRNRYSTLYLRPVSRTN